MRCEQPVVKNRALISSFVVAIAGLGLMIGGIALERLIQTYREYFDEMFLALSIILIVIGCIAFIVAFFGCCGAIRENHVMLLTYVNIVLTIIIIQIVVAGLAFAYRYDKEREDNHMKVKYYFDNYENNTVIVDNIQSYLQCCGYNGPQDYSSKDSVPTSCCKTKDPCEPKCLDIYEKSCGQAIDDSTIGLGNIIGGVALGVAALEIIAIIFALCLAISIKNVERARVEDL